MKTPKFMLLALLTASLSIPASAERLEPIKYGNMDSWITRCIKESGLIGGKEKKVYAVGPTKLIQGNEPYTYYAGSPWASSNVMAKVAGITKTSNAVYPDRRDNGYCAKLCSQLESCKALGVVNIDVMVAGSLFLGQMLEPITGTSNPYAKMDMGIAFTKRPTALVYDYKVDMPASDERIYSSGFSKKHTVKGHDNPEVMVLLQRRWEDADGNIYAKRVGTARELITTGNGTWHNAHHLNIVYGDPASSSAKVTKGLIPAGKSYYARNSKGRMVPVKEVGWDSPDATPTHIIVMFSAGSGEPYIGTPGLALSVDNVSLAYNE